jgi:hypothetical protein
MHKTTNPVFSQFIRLQPWAFSLSLVGLLTLGSCTPPATQKLLQPTAPSSSPIWLDNVPNLKSPTPQTNQNLHFGLGDFKIQGYPLCGNTPEEAQASYGSANACYSAGGSPLWSQQETGNLDWFGRPEICITFNKCEFPVGGGGGNGNENPDNDECEGKCDGAGAAPFDLLMVHNNLPANGLKPLGDDVQSQVTISPADVNDAYDSARLVINDRDNKGWKLELFKPNGKLLYEESGQGNSVAGWDGLDENLALSNGMYRAKLTQIENPGIFLERTVRVDNAKPVINNLRVQEDARTNSYTVKATLKEAGNGTFQSGVNPAKTKLFFDDGVDRDDANKNYNAETGEYSVTFSDLAQYRIAKQQSQQQNGYDFPFELQIADYAGNQASNRGSGPDGPLRIQVTDPYFSPNADGVKDSLNFKVIAETSEPYLVAIKRNGATIKGWTGLTGEQNLSWDGLQNGQALADGSYRIVAMTEKQRDRVRDAQMVVLDNSPPEITYTFKQKDEGLAEVRAVIQDKESGIESESIEVLPFFQEEGWNIYEQTVIEKSEKRTVLNFKLIMPVLVIDAPFVGSPPGLNPPYGIPNQFNTLSNFSIKQTSPDSPIMTITPFQIAAKNKTETKQKKDVEIEFIRRKQKIEMDESCYQKSYGPNGVYKISSALEIDNGGGNITLSFSGESQKAPLFHNYPLVSASSDLSGSIKILNDSASNDVFFHSAKSSDTSIPLQNRVNAINALNQKMNLDEESGQISIIYLKNIKTEAKNANIKMQTASIDYLINAIKSHPYTSIANSDRVHFLSLQLDNPENNYANSFARKVDALPNKTSNISINAPGFPQEISLSLTVNCILAKKDGIPSKICTWKKIKCN